MRRIVFFFLSIVMAISAFAQNTKQITVSFIPVIDDKIIKIGEDILIDSSLPVAIKVTKLKFYVSHLSFYNNEKLVWKDNAVAHLMDAENNMSIRLTVKKDMDVNTIRFGLGIDSITNVSGALDGDLDPLKGMYWTWQSGYVNCKLEGTMPDKNLADQKFEYHLGGYSGENNAYSTIELTIENSNTIQVSLDIGKFISNWYAGAHPNIMSPGKTAVELSKILSTCFSIK